MNCLVCNRPQDPEQASFSLDEDNFVHAKCLAKIPKRIGLLESRVADLEQKLENLRRFH